MDAVDKAFEKAGVRAGQLNHHDVRRLRWLIEDYLMDEARAKEDRNAVRLNQVRRDFECELEKLAGAVRQRLGDTKSQLPGDK